MNYGSNAMGFDDSPDEVGDPSNRYKVGFDGEEVPYLVHWEPDRRQTAKPEEEEAEKIPSICPRADWQAVGQMFVIGPDRSNHDCNAFPLKGR